MIGQYIINKCNKCIKKNLLHEFHISQNLMLATDIIRWKNKIQPGVKFKIFS